MDFEEYRQGSRRGRDGIWSYICRFSTYLFSSISSLVYQGYELLCECKKRALSVFFVMLEIITLVLDVCGQNRWSTLLGAFLLSVLGFVMTSLTCMLERQGVYAEKQLGVVDISFSAVQLIDTFLPVLGIKMNNNYYTAHVLLLVFAIINAVFAFIKDDNSISSLSLTSEYENELKVNKNELQVIQNELQVNENELLSNQNEHKVNKNELQVNENELLSNHNELKVNKNELQVNENEQQANENELLSNQNELQVNENELQVNENELLSNQNELKVNKNELQVNENEQQANENELLSNQNELQVNENELLSNQNELQVNENELLSNQNELQVNENELLSNQHELKVNENELLSNQHELKVNENELLSNKNELQVNENDLQGNENELQLMEPPVTTAFLKLALHCEGCIVKIKNTLKKTKGVFSVKVDMQEELVTVTGTMDAKALAETLKKRLKRPVEIVPPKKAF
ncbi:hypothetical protein Patl1_22201 [Pistacia atlantica]|uniref:Uncharacterized protein n=1 Tax=Pistacia atlantica TaxID=434234 RepID=A0ACC1BHE7_9ROSI|nr:hypothetical protein Patl1_22201 [Pistacia atlantica]